MHTATSRRFLWFFLFLNFAVLVDGRNVVPAEARPLTDALAAIQAVDSRGRGHAEAQSAWQRAAESEVHELPDLLAAMDGMGPLATNWLRAAVDTVAERALQRGELLPANALEQFIQDRSHGPRPRRLAFEWLIRVAPERRETLLQEMLDDPSLELRYDAVAKVMAQAQATNEAAQAIADYRRALDASRDIAQIKACVKALGELGVPVNLVQHLGLITSWTLIGPFDNSNEAGFDKVYPPENEIDLTAKYTGKLGTVTWQKKESEDPNGLIDLNKLIGQLQGTVAYAITDFVVEQGQPAQIRLASYNATKVWLNGTLVDANEVYHTAMPLDQYITDVQLRPGRNVILVKVCQNEEEADYAQTWQFQLRMTDALGQAIHPHDSELEANPGGKHK